MNIDELKSVAKGLVSKGKGILAADESSGTIKKRFDSINVESKEENRRSYRELLFTTPGAEEFISGVILFDETIRQATQDGTSLPKVLEQSGIIPGIKVDAGAKDLAGFPGEKITEGLDGLRERLAEYRNLGARFAKWRAVITIGAGSPSQFCIDANSHALARYAALCHEAGLVPIVEPEVLMDGDHTIERCEEVTTATLKSVFSELKNHRVELEGILLKPNMVLSGKECAVQAGVDAVAEATIRCFRQTVPEEMPGIVFLSGGQSPQEATEHLNAMNALGSHPWELSFSYGRALQEPVLKAWMGQSANVTKAQETFYHRAKCNGAARHGNYSPTMEKIAA
ncbi:fructose-bisphosphate aldolase class I [candidate division KSB1 bacterium]|nr:fructose-bisphosphate aldolase class I [candidate division KSB1 bacterium]TDJ03781.1 MAG: fructose-bisphosphate aldolase class I [Caldithrix sp.]